MNNCWLRFRLHKWSKADRPGGFHRWKDCINCNAVRMTAHVSCPKECWGGPA